MHHAEILIGHFREMVGNWPVASFYFALYLPPRLSSMWSMFWRRRLPGSQAPLPVSLLRS